MKKVVTNIYKICLTILFITSVSTLSLSKISNTSPPPIVYTIAGSDSGGGAGIQADLHAIHSMNCHGCSVITCLTAQNSMGVSGVHYPPIEFFKLQLSTLTSDLPPHAIKIGMIGSQDLASEISSFLQLIKKNKNQNDTNNSSNNNNDDDDEPFVVLDPVMISTSGHKLIEDRTKDIIMQDIFPYIDLLTPNKFEAEEILGRKLDTIQDVEQGAKDIIAMGVRSVLIKGGHTSSSNLVANKYAQDYFLSSDEPLKINEERICDGSRGVWLRSKRFDTLHTHGTGCTLSSTIASAMAIGKQQRELVNNDIGTGANRSILTIDACCLAKSYISSGVEQAVQLGKGPGPVTHTSAISSHRHFPSIVINPSDEESSDKPQFLPMASSINHQSSSSHSSEKTKLGVLLPIVNTVEWVERLCKVKHITDIQLRIKGETDPDKINEIVQKSQDFCNKAGIRLWVNDYWKAALQAKCFGVHLGQEDLAKCANQGGIEAMKKANMAFGISTHSYAELAVAIGLKPSYISLGPVFGTQSKDVAFDPQGLDTVKIWKQLIDPNIPLVAIGGINDVDAVQSIKNAGADCAAVISAVTKASDVDDAVEKLVNAMTSVSS